MSVTYMADEVVELYWQFPQPLKEEKDYIKYLALVKQMEDHSFTGCLITEHISSLNPWVLAISMLQMTKNFIPLVAAQPYTMKPTTAASIIRTIAQIYSRKVNINLITGFHQSDLDQICDPLNKEQRYRRLGEYAEILRSLLISNEPYYFKGEYYQYQGLQAYCKIDPDLMPRFCIPMTNGSVESLEAIRNHANTVLVMPESISHFESFYRSQLSGVRGNIGIKFSVIARALSQLAMDQFKREDAHIRVRTMKKNIQINTYGLSVGEEEVYYPGVDHNGAYIVGSYGQVCDYLMKFVSMGVRMFVIPNIRTLEDIEHVHAVFSKVRKVLREGRNGTNGRTV
jgi:alkanesulfonate monooxygenase SsuD/methylene tetrahydromethanopterin reductase-like flavin-dependent oxidoreductase (luciferase family)